MIRSFQVTHFKGKQFKKEIITVAVGYYLRYNLSYREVSEIMSDRGIGDSWRMNETYIKVKGKWRYLYQAIGSSGLTLDI